MSLSQWARNAPAVVISPSGVVSERSWVLSSLLLRLSFQLIGAIIALKVVML